MGSPRTSPDGSGRQIVMAGLVPAISTRIAQCPPYRDRRDEPGDDTELLLGALARLRLAALLLLVGFLLAALMLLVGLHAAALLLLARLVRLLAGILIGIVGIGHKHLLEGLPRPISKRPEMKRVRARNDQLGDTFP